MVVMSIGYYMARQTQPPLQQRDQQADLQADLQAISNPGYRVEFVSEICEGKQFEEEQLVQAIEAARSCELDSDCKIVSFGCPFGCANSINKNSEAALAAKVAEFREDDCPSCAYRCRNLTHEPRCVVGVCSSVDYDSQQLVPPDA